MNNTQRFCIVFLVSMAVLVAGVQAQQQATPYSKVLSLSLLGNTLGTTSSDMQDHFTPILEGLAPRPKAIFSQLLDKSFNRDSLAAFAELYLRHHADTRKTEEALAWLNTPVVQRVHKEHRKALQPSAYKKIAAFVRKATTDPKTKKRRELLHSFMEEQAKATTEVTIALTRQALSVLNTLPSEQQPLTAEEITTMAESMRADVLAYNQGTLEGLYLYVFRSVSDGDMQQYLDGCQSELGQWLNQLQWETYTQTCSNAALLFVWRLQQAYKEALQSKPELKPEPDTASSHNSSKAVSDALHKQAEGTGGRVLGVITATVNNSPWYGYFNAEKNKDKTLSLLALNTDATPNEQVEVSFAFHGTGTYPLAAGSAAFYKVVNGSATESYFSQGAKTDRVVITSYNKQENIIEGSLVFTAKNDQGKISFAAKKFTVRIQ